MKLAQVNLKQVIPSSGAFSTALYTATKGFDLVVNETARLVAATHGGKTKLIPFENILSMEPLAEKAAKK